MHATSISSSSPTAGNSSVTGLEQAVAARALPSNSHRRTPIDRAKTAAQWKKWSATHKRTPKTIQQKAAVRIRVTAWNKANPDKVRAYQKKHLSKPSVKARKAASMRAWRSIPSNSEKVAAWNKRWRENNPVRRQALHMKRRAMIATATVAPQSIEAFVARIRSKRKVRCYYCKCSISGKQVHIDHIVALNLGGQHSIDNLCSSCPSCNLKKGAKPLFDLRFISQTLLCL